MRVFRKRLSIGVCLCVCASFLFGSEGWMWDLTVLVSDYRIFIFVKPACCGERDIVVTTSGWCMCMHALCVRKCVRPDLFGP